MKMKRMITFATVTTLALVLNACGGGSSSSGTTIQGKLVDSPVSGAQYRCGQVDSVTKADGTFACETLPVTFYVGGVTLGTVSRLHEDHYVTPQDLVGVPRDNYDTKVNNVAVFLQSLDDDGNIDTSIQIRKETRDRLKDKQNNVATMTYVQITELLTEVNAARVVTQEKARVHLQTQLQSVAATNATTAANTAATNATTAANTAATNATTAANTAATNVGIK